MSQANEPLHVDQQSEELNEREGLAGIILIVSRNTFDDSEHWSKNFAELVNRLHLYEESNPRGFEELVDKLLAIVKREGEAGLLRAAADVLCEESCETAVALAADIAASTGHFGDKETALLNTILEAVQISDEMVAKILQITAIKYRIP